MDILFPKSTLTSFRNKISDYSQAGYQSNYIGESLQFRFIPPGIEAYSTVRNMQGEGIVFTGFPGYLRMTKTNYQNNDVPVGVTGSQELDVDGVPTGNQKTWEEWQPNVVLERLDNVEVIITTTYSNQAASSADLELLETSADVAEAMSISELQATYQNDAAWVDFDGGSPVEKTALYYTINWQKEAFDFLHAQRLVNQWFQTLPGGTTTDKFNSLSNVEKKEVIRWGILDDTATGKGLIEATILNKNNRAAYRAWHIRRLMEARTVRFNTAWVFLVDNFKNNAIITRMQEMLTYEMKEFYILRGASNQSNHLIVNGEINPTFWATFLASDEGYSDFDLATIKARVEQILDGNKFANPVI